MFNKDVVVRCESGLHNRQATYFVQKANEFESSIWLESANRKMNAKSLLGIMSLGIVTGATVNLIASGSDADIQKCPDLFSDKDGFVVFLGDLITGFAFEKIVDVIAFVQLAQ